MDEAMQIKDTEKCFAFLVSLRNPDFKEIR